MKSKLILLFFIVSLPALAETPLVVKLSGQDENMKLSFRYNEKKIDTRELVYDGACYQGRDVIGLNGITIVKDKYSMCKQTMYVPTCKIESRQMKTRDVTYTTVCGTPLLSSINVSGLNVSGYFYPSKCEKTVQVSYCERVVEVNRDIELDVKNFTNKTDQSLTFGKSGLESLSPSNIYFALEQRKVSRKETDLFHAQEIHKYKVSIMDTNEVLDFDFSEISRNKDEFSLGFSPELQKYKDLFALKFKVSRKRLLSNTFEDVGETVLGAESATNMLSVNFKAEKNVGRVHKMIVELGHDDRYSVLSKNPTVQYKNIRTLEFIPKD